MGRPRKIRIEPPKPFNFLVSVIRGGKVVMQRSYGYINEAFAFKFRKEREEDCEVEIHKVRTVARVVPQIKIRPWNGKDWSKPIRCVETGEVYESFVACEHKTGLTRYQIKNSIKRGILAGECHYELVKNE